MIVGLHTFNWGITGYFADRLGDRQTMAPMAIAMFSILVPMVFWNRRLMTLGSSMNPIEGRIGRVAQLLESGARLDNSSHRRDAGKGG